MREEDWPTTPEAIAALLARMEQVEPGWLSPEDDAAWRAALRAQIECSSLNREAVVLQSPGSPRGAPRDTLRNATISR
jgi:hypothetical protein